MLSERVNAKGGTTWGQSSRMEAAGENEYTASDERKPTADQCPGKDDGTGTIYRGAGKPMDIDVVRAKVKCYGVWSAWALQTRLSQTAQNKGRGATTHRVLLGSHSDKGENGLED